jgi:hypothetical protein
LLYVLQDFDTADLYLLYDADAHAPSKREDIERPANNRNAADGAGESGRRR